MGVDRVSLKDTGIICIFADGLIFIFYATFVPSVVSGIHWLITVAAILFLVALPTIYQPLHRPGRVAAKVVVGLIAAAMITIIASDLFFTLSLFSGFEHDVTYTLGNAMFIISIMALGVMALRGVLFKWFGDLSILTGLVGVSTYIPGSPTFLPMISLILIGLWSLSLGFNVWKLAK